MFDLSDLLQRIPINNMTVLVFAAGVGVLGYAAFLALRFAWTVSPRRPTAKPRDALDDGILARYSNGRSGTGTGWAARMDGAFDLMVQRTGLELAPAQALGWIALAAVTLALLLFLWRPDWWMGALGFIGGGAAVLATYLFLQARYRRRLQDELPDVIFMLSRSARAGLSLERAIELAGEQGGKTIAAEFRRCSLQISLGLSVASAMKNAARRIQLMDFNSLVSTIALYQGSGGNLPMLLDRLAGSTRDHNQFRGYMRSATAMGRITALAIAAATPLILAGYLIYQPDYAQSFFHSSTGMAVIAIALGMEVIGGLWLYQLLSVDV